MLSIEDMSNINKSIYSKSNENLEFEYMYSYLTRKISYLSRGFLRNNGHDNEDIMNVFIQSLSWIFSLCQKLDIDPQKAFYKKFPSCCPYCLLKPCSCTQTHRKPEKIKSAIYIKNELSSYYDGLIFNRENMIDPTKMINDIYPSNRNIWSVFGGFYHSSRLFEELGELHESYSKMQKDKYYNRENLEEEFADVFAWLYSLWGINFSDDLGDRFASYYINGCPICNHKECICTPYSGRAFSTEGKKDLLIKLIENLNLLLGDANFKEQHQDIQAALSSLSDAIESGKDIDSRRTINEIEAVLETTNKNTGHVSGIVTNVINTIMTLKQFLGF